MPKKKQPRNNPRILILGDSFAADWSVKYQDYPGWPNLLAKTYPVVNLAQAGVSEYKIYQQLLSVKNLEEFDLIIISHTGPHRVHTRRHPIHADDVLHKDADLMMSDLWYHKNRIKNIFNKSLHTAVGFFKYHFDSEYFETIYKLLRKQIHEILKNKKIIVISNLPNNSIYNEDDVTVLDFSNLCQTNKGTANHLDEAGNKIIYQDIIKVIE